MFFDGSQKSKLKLNTGASKKIKFFVWISNFICPFQIRYLENKIKQIIIVKVNFHF
jgi:hypothetical protein